MDMSSPDVLSQVEAQGFAVVPGFDVSTPDIARTELLAYFQSIASPISFFGQALIMDVRPQPGYQPASSGGAGHFDLHTDLTFHETPPKLFGLHCVSSDEEGGDSLLADGYEVLRELGEDERLRSTDVAFPAPAHVGTEPVVHRIVSGDSERPTIRFRSDLALAAGSQAAELINKCQSAARSIMQVMHLTPGELLLVDNHRMLHGRTEITASPSRRHLLRIYANPK